MITDTRDRIIKYVQYHGQARAHDLQRELQISNVAVHKQLKKLLSDGIIARKGKPPLVFYVLCVETNEAIQITETEQLSAHVKQIIEANFLSITPDGNLLYGIKGFIYWKNLYQNEKPFGIVAREYADLLGEQKKYFSEKSWIEATLKLKNAFKEAFVDHLLLQEIYSYKLFGRTKLAKLVMYAKQTGQRELIDKISFMAKPVIEKIIKTYSIDAVLFIPPTVPRPIQFMDEFASRLSLSLPEIKLVKVVPGDIPIPQKTLSSVEERVINARSSIYLKDTKESPYKNVLLIDDVAGSGASFNETAKKLKAVKVKNIIAFALVGNLKGFDVIREI